MTIRQVAQLCGVSKSTVHKYLNTYTTSKIRKALLRRQLSINAAEATKRATAASVKTYAERRAAKGMS